jgi:hypothetical protein
LCINNKYFGFSVQVVVTVVVVVLWWWCVCIS